MRNVCLEIKGMLPKHTEFKALKSIVRITSGIELCLVIMGIFPKADRTYLNTAQIDLHKILRLPCASKQCALQLSLYIMVGITTEIH